jgi:hypothetical protein
LENKARADVGRVFSRESELRDAMEHKCLDVLELTAEVRRLNAEAPEIPDPEYRFAEAAGIAKYMLDASKSDLYIDLRKEAVDAGLAINELLAEVARLNGCLEAVCDVTSNAVAFGEHPEPGRIMEAVRGS